MYLAWSRDCSASQLLLIVMPPELRLSSGSIQRRSEGGLCAESQPSEPFACGGHSSLAQHPCGPGCTGGTHARPDQPPLHSTTLTLTPEGLSVLQVVQALHVLSNHIVFHNLSTPEQILSLFPESFHSSLKNLLTKILLEN